MYHVWSHLLIHLCTLCFSSFSTLADAYSRLPVVIVPSLLALLQNADGLTPSLLDQWVQKYSPYYEPNSTLREQTLERLGTKYWWNIMVEKYDEEMSKLRNNKNAIKNTSTSNGSHKHSNNTTTNENVVTGNQTHHHYFETHHKHNTTADVPMADNPTRHDNSTHHASSHVGSSVQPPHHNATKVIGERSGQIRRRNNNRAVLDNVHR